MPDVGVTQSVDILPYLFGELRGAGNFGDFLQLLLPRNANAGPSPRRSGFIDAPEADCFGHAGGSFCSNGGLTADTPS